MENMNLESEIRSDLHFDDLVGGSEGGPLLERSDAPAVRYANLAEVPDDVAGIEEWNVTDGIPTLFDWDFRGRREGSRIHQSDPRSPGFALSLRQSETSRPG